ncbi:MAG TPA: metal ABC transporter substrate-binding protein, partial [Solirubrobacteraceae bacterium]|nr:metal ABC transporter substrate-binding protein [Solirubrobacteraceae bacterium]
GGPGAARAAAPLPVVATTTQLGDFVRQVGGADVKVTQILRPNTDPHEYEPRPSDVRGTAGARLVVQSGNRLDRWMAKVVSESGAKPAILTIAPAHTPQRIAGERSGPEASRFDPHWWHDPRNAEAAVAAIRDALSKADPAAKARFAANAKRYLAQLRALDAGIARCFAAVPRSERRLVTDHDAFGYFARRYGITVVGAVIPSQTTQSQPSAGDVARLVKLIEREHVKAVFPESSINKKLAQAIARQTGASSRYTLYGDTLGPKDSDGATYLAMERHNADAMMRGFTGGSRGCAISSSPSR